MKRKILSFAFSVILILSCCFNVAALETAEFYLSCSNADNNRIFPLEIYAKGSNVNLSAVKIQLSYDISFVEFREVKCSIPGAEVKADSKNKTIDIIFLSNNGVNISNKTHIATVRLKAENSGNTKINMTCSQTINSSVKDVSVNYVENIDINIKGKSIKGTTTKVKNPVVKNNSIKKSSSNSNTGKNSLTDNDNNYGKYNADDGTIEDFIEDDFQDDNNGFLANISNNNFTAFIAGIAAVLLLLGIFLIAYYLGKKSKKNNKEENDNKSVPLEDIDDDKKEEN